MIAEAGRPMGQPESYDAPISSFQAYGPNVRTGRLANLVLKS